MVEKQVADAPRPLLAHLEELMIRLRRIALWIFGGAMVGYVFSERLVHWIEVPLLERLHNGAKLVYTTPFEKIWVHLRMSLIGGVLLVLPFVAREVAAFVSPGLKLREKRRAKWLVISISVAFLAGVALGYYFVLPAVLQALLHYGGEGVTPFLTLSSYTNAALGILLLSALLMELPVVMAHLSAWGWVQAASWSKGRKAALVANAAVSAILSPPDVMSMLVMMIPVQLLYECGIFLSRVAQWYFNERLVVQTDEAV